MEQARHRITSYNVCYTKLLRSTDRESERVDGLCVRVNGDPIGIIDDFELAISIDAISKCSFTVPNVSEMRSIFVPQRDPFLQISYDGVITSYSIHYTKLYETTEVRDGIVKLSDVVTCYHPTGEEPPGFRYVCDFAKRCTIINELALEFDSAKWAGVPLIPDNQVSRNPAAKHPKDATASLYRIIDTTALDAIIANPDFAKEASSSSIGLTNPKRLDVKLVAMLAGNTNVISIDFSSGFNYES